MTSGVVRAMPIDHRRGRAGMQLFIASEALLFVMLFFAYAYLRQINPIWAVPAPSIAPALVMLAVLLASSGIVHWGQRRLARGQSRSARLSLVVGAALGAAFLALQAGEYRHRLQEIGPGTNAYGSLFYAITGIHGAHVALGIAMLLYVCLLPDLVSPNRPPHRPFETAALYWHFVDAVWIAIVIVLYLLPAVRA